MWGAGHRTLLITLSLWSRMNDIIASAYLSITLVIMVIMPHVEVHEGSHCLDGVNVGGAGWPGTVQELAGLSQSVSRLDGYTQDLVGLSQSIG